MRYAGIFLMLVILAGTTDASFIRMTTTLTADKLITSKNTFINVTFVNSGDEPAHDVQATLVLSDGFSTEPAYIGIMQPNVEYTQYYNVSISESLPGGRYPIVIKLHYSDANAYPFSIISPAFVLYKKTTPIMIRGMMSSVDVAGEQQKELKLKIMNMDTKAHNLKIRLHTSDEIKATPLETEVYAQGNQEAEATFNVENFGALPNSAYVVFATMEYEDGLHFSSIATGVVKIVDKSGSSAFPSWIPLAVLVLLIGAFVYYQFKH